MNPPLTCHLLSHNLELRQNQGKSENRWSLDQSEGNQAASLWLMRTNSVRCCFFTISLAKSLRLGVCTVKLEQVELRLSDAKTERLTYCHSGASNAVVPGVLDAASVKACGLTLIPNSYE